MAEPCVVQGYQTATLGRMALEDAEPRSFIAVPPDERRIRTRTASRVLVIANDKILLEEDSDPAFPRFIWWVTPGGGIGPGESYRQGAVRELEEETGLSTSEDQLEGPIAGRTIYHGYSDTILIQREEFFRLHTTHFEAITSGYTREEQITLKGARWFSRSQLASVVVWPPRLAELWDLADGEYLEMGEVEESTVPLSVEQRAVRL